MDDKLREWFGERLSADGLKLTVKLAKPHQLGDKITEEITLTEPTVYQVEQAQKKNTALAQTRELIAIVGAVPEGAVNLLPISEFQRADRFLSGFTAGGPQDGGIT